MDINSKNQEDKIDTSKNIVFGRNPVFEYLKTEKNVDQIMF